MKTNYLKQLSKETFIYGISGMISKFIMIFLVPIYTRIFSPQDYGVISILNTTMIFVSIFIVMGLDSAAHRWYWEKDDEYYKKKTISTWFWFQIICSIIFSLIFLTFSRQLSRILLQKEEYNVYFKIIALYFPFSVSNSILINLFRMQRKALSCLYYTLFFSLLNILSSIILVLFFKFGISGVLYAQVITFLLNTIFSLFILKEWIRPTYFSDDFLKKMLRYSLPLIPASLSYWIVNLSGNYFVNYLTDTSQVGLYQVGNTIASGIGFITGAFQQAIGPFALSIFKENHSKKIYADILSYYVIILCLLCVLFNLFSYEILIFFTNRNYEGSHKVIPLLTFTYIAIGMSYVAMIGSTIVKTTKPYAEAVIISAIIVIFLYVILIPKFGIIGASISSLISQFFIVIYIFLKSQKLYKIPYQFKDVIFILIFSLTLSLIASNIKFKNYLNTILLKTAFLLVFFFVISLNTRIRNNLRYLIELIFYRTNKSFI